MVRVKFTFQMVSLTISGLDQNQEPESPSRSPRTCVAGAQVLVPLSRAFPDTLSGCRWEAEHPGLQPPL